MKYSTVLLCAAPLISDTPNLAVIGQVYFAKVVFSQSLQLIDILEFSKLNLSFLCSKYTHFILFTQHVNGGSNLFVNSYDVVFFSTHKPNKQTDKQTKIKETNKQTNKIKKNPTK